MEILHVLLTLHHYLLTLQKAVLNLEFVGTIQFRGIFETSVSCSLKYLSTCLLFRFLRLIRLFGTNPICFGAVCFFENQSKMPAELLIIETQGPVTVPRAMRRASSTVHAGPVTIICRRPFFLSRALITTLQPVTNATRSLAAAVQVCFSSTWPSKVCTTVTVCLRTSSKNRQELSSDMAHPNTMAGASQKKAPQSRAQLFFVVVIKLSVFDFILSQSGPRA